MTPDPTAGARGLRPLTVLCVLLFAATAAAQLLMAAAQLREGGLLDLVSDDPAGFSQRRVDDAEDIVQGSALTATLLGLLVLPLLGGFLAQTTGIVQRRTGLPPRHGPVMAGLGIFIPFYGLVVLVRVLGELWERSAGRDGRRPRWPLVALLTWITGNVLFAQTVAQDSGGARTVGAAGLVLSSTFPLALLAFVAVTYGRLTAGSGRARPPALTRVVATASAVLLVVGLVHGTSEAARVPDGPRLTATDEALPTPAPTTVTRPFELRTPRFVVRLPDRPDRTVERVPLQGGTAVVTTWTVTSGTNDLAVVESVYPFELDGPKAAITTVSETAKSIGGKASSVTRGTVGGHAYAQAVVTDADGRRLGVRVVALPRATVAVLVQPVGALSGLLATFRAS